MKLSELINETNGIIGGIATLASYLGIRYAKRDKSPCKKCRLCDNKLFSKISELEVTVENTFILNDFKTAIYRDLCGIKLRESYMIKNAICRVHQLLLDAESDDKEAKRLAFCELWIAIKSMIEAYESKWLISGIHKEFLLLGKAIHKDAIRDVRIQIELAYNSNELPRETISNLLNTMTNAYTNFVVRMRTEIAELNGSIAGYVYKGIVNTNESVGNKHKTDLRFMYSYEE